MSHRLYTALVLLIGCWPVMATAEVRRDGQVTSYSGEVSIDSYGARVIVLVDTLEAGGRDGVVDQWFVLQAEEAMPPLAEHLENAQIVQSAESLRIVSHGNGVLFDLLVTGRGSAAEAPANFNTTRLEGIGLSHYKGETTIRISHIRGDGLTAFNCAGCGLFDQE